MSYLGPLDVPPPGERGSSVGAGAVNVDYPIGAGRHTLYVAAIHTDVAYEQECSINVVWKAGDGTETVMCLGSGVLSNNRPFAIASTRHLEGLGFIRATVYNLEADTTWTFKVNYVGGWTVV